MNMKIKLIISACIVFLNTGCGTLMHGKDQRVSLKTDPPGALVNVGGFKLKTPATAVLNSNKGYSVSITKEGYKQKDMLLVKHIDSIAIVGNIFTAGIGIIVDYYTGSLYILLPEIVKVSLEEVPKKKMYELLD